VEEEH